MAKVSNDPNLPKRIKAEMSSDLSLGLSRTVDYTRDLVSVPVEYEGGSVIRSRPGEPPRMETGELRENITFTVVEDADGIKGTFISTRPSTPHVPAELEYGMDRHYMGHGFDMAVTEFIPDSLNLRQ